MKFKAFAAVLLAGLLLLGGTAAPALADSPTYTLSGTVKARNLPVGAGQVTLEYTASGQVHDPDDYVSTDANGFYAITGLMPGSYVVYVRYNGVGYLSQWLNQSANDIDPLPDHAIVITDADRVINLALFPTVTLTGTVFLGATGIVPPVGQVQVQYRLARSFNPWSDPVEVDSDGKYTFLGVPRYTYQIRFSYTGPDHYARFWYLPGRDSPPLENDPISPDRPTGDVATIDDAVILATKPISGTLTNSAGNPIAGEQVTAIGTPLDPNQVGEPQNYTSTTDSAGLYTFDALPSEFSYVLSFGGLENASIYSSTRWSTYSGPYLSGTPIRVADGMPNSPHDAVLTLRSNLEFTVVGTGLPLTASNVYFYVRWLDPSTNTWMGGGGDQWAGDLTPSVSRDLPPGDYQVTVVYGELSPPSMQVTSPILHLSEGQTVRFSADLATGTGSLPLPTGTLARSSTNSQAFLVDGDTRLVPVTSISTAIDAGFSPAVTVASTAALAFYSIATTPLTNAILCGGTDYFFAGDSKLYPVPAELVTGLPLTNLDAATCAVLPHATSPISGALLVQGNLGGTTYFVTSPGVKRPLLAASAGAALSAPNAAVVVHTSSVFLNSLPVGASVIPPGSLVKSSSGPTIYLADGFTKLVPVWVFSTVTDAGIPGSFYTVPQSTLAGYTVSTTPTRNVITCPTATYFAGSGKIWPVAPSIVANLSSMTLQATTCAALPKGAQQIAHALFVKTPSDPLIYNITPGGSKRPVIVASMMATMAAPDPVLILNVGDIVLAPLRQGVDLVPAGTIIRLGWDTVPLLVDGAGGTFKLRSTESVTDFGFSAGSHITNTVSYNTMPPAANGLNNLVSCGGVVWIAGKGSGIGQLWHINASNYGSIPITALPSTLCAFITKNANPAPTNVLLKASNGTVIYSLEAGKKRPITSDATAASMGAGNPVAYLTVNPDFLASVPTGTTIP